MRLKFQRPNIYGRNKKKRVKNTWRKPRGIDSKQRKKRKGYGIHPDVGYGTPKQERNKHALGLVDVLVSNKKQLDSLDPSKNCIRFSSTLGKRKKAEFRKIANEKKFKNSPSDVI